jgi:hypothetical protein
MTEALAVAVEMESVTLVVAVVSDDAELIAALVAQVTKTWRALSTPSRLLVCVMNVAMYRMK